MVGSTDSEDASASLDIAYQQQQGLDSEQAQQLSETTQGHGNPLEELVGISLPPLTFPKTIYQGHEAPKPKSTEREAVEALLNEPGIDRQTYDENEFISFQLDDFVIYALPDHSPTPHGMVSLDQVATKFGKQTVVFFFDGVLKGPGNQGQYLERVPFRLVSIGGYEAVEQHSVGKDMWIQSLYGTSTSIGDLWYQLGTPAPEYKDYYHSFCWLADLAKYFIDYLHHHENVTLHHFKIDFSSWLTDLHGTDTSFIRWMAEYRSLDFRQAINSYSSFLEKQAWDLDPAYCTHPLWAELGVTQDNLVLPMQPQKAEGTIVTPYVYQCFKNMEWGNHLTAVELDPQISASHQTRLRELGFLPKVMPVKKMKSGFTVGLDSTTAIRPKDVIAIRRDLKTPWKGTENLWYAAVQDVQPRKNRPARLSLIWLYRPSETVCADLTYPHANEIFFSDHCNCQDGVIDTSDIVEKVTVTFFAQQAEKGAQFFIRQTYFSEDETFTSLKEEHFKCQCRKPRSKPEFKVGDTVLIENFDELNPDQINLEPAEILGFGESGQVNVRVFLRRGRDYNDAGCRPNELVYTNRTRTVHVDQIERRCQVRCYTEEQKRDGSIPAPYNRDGTGDAFYVTVQEISSDRGSELVSIQHPPVGFREGYDYSEDSSLRKLRALNIFSGGGSFDRGLEEGGAIKNRWAVEWSAAPMLTYRANHENPEKVKLFLGSVNDFLLQALQQKAEAGNLIAKLGDVEVISAGSPCQGYSNVNNRKNNAVSMQNSSMIASVASYVDFYRPQYAILENVIAMSNRTHKRNPLCQLLCTFVGMGYQARVLNLDAWSFGAPQSRSRLFIVIAAPGLQLPAHPPLTHSHPPKTTQKSLGEAPNGLPFGKRHWEIPVFDFLPISQSLKDLPRIRTGITPIDYPDHRPTRFESAVNQHIINSVPKAPRIQGLHEAVARGFFCPEHRNARQRNCQRAFSRIHPRFLMPTVTTFPSPYCRFTGRWLHWEEDRVMTVMEARRAQGFPDDEVLVGSPVQQWKTVGNSVARQVALALGLVMRDAVLQNQLNEKAKNNTMVTNGIQVVVERLKEKSMWSTTDPAAEPGEEASNSETGAARNVTLPCELAVLLPKSPNEAHFGSAPKSSLTGPTDDDRPTPSAHDSGIQQTASSLTTTLTPWSARSTSVPTSTDESAPPNNTSGGDNISINLDHRRRSVALSSNTFGSGSVPVPLKKRRLNDETRSGKNEFPSRLL
ncbi:DNA methyltransferase Dim-2 [Blastomyces dermatitidis ER-3]|uniref:DNA (cytosine-5-)-methyltransferase n=2 Tax=Blastomyces TaxID=229219 RepID=A0A179U766_BLAGS|nr:DNA methyltransferase Dim-2 [Blastomyces gilchristii SLH14081]XP_045273515.1 DNA methyltransferase Dim-2 [Blastomyces dermatitidis ER-3]EEQ85853.1 DNA methyltransferase Dim-2 [Blastomyces dermatitidis ER-3]OAT03670.1 DNA methyltransferase Dim-2 [Blastomyces gilchristii SLH14081]